MIILLTFLISCYWQSVSNLPIIDTAYDVECLADGVCRVTIYSLYQSDSESTISSDEVEIQYSINSKTDFNTYYTPFLVNHNDVVRVRLSAYAANGKRCFSSYEIIDIDPEINLADQNDAYNIGDEGPAGGYIFYDCDADNTADDPDGADNLKSSICGWRYLEVAPNDLRVVYKEPTVDASVSGYDIAPTNYVFGYYRTSVYGSNLYMLTTPSIGTGEKNTEKLVEAMGYYAYLLPDEPEITTNYAARLCSTLKHEGYDDWFLPSIDELELIYNNLLKKEKGNLLKNYYLSSTEWTATTAFVFNFNTGSYREQERYNSYCIRPVRAF